MASYTSKQATSGVGDLDYALSKSYSYVHFLKKDVLLKNPTALLNIVKISSAVPGCPKAVRAALTHREHG